MAEMQQVEKNEVEEVRSVDDFLVDREYVSLIPGMIGKFDWLFRKYNEWIAKSKYEHAVSKESFLKIIRLRYRMFHTDGVLYIKDICGSRDECISDIPQERSVSAFIDSQMVLRAGFRYGSAKIYSHYLVFCGKNNLKPLSFDKFRKEVSYSNKLVSIPNRNGKVFENIIGLCPNYQNIFNLDKGNIVTVSPETLEEMVSLKKEIDEVYTNLRDKGNFSEVTTVTSKPMIGNKKANNSNAIEKTLREFDFDNGKGFEKLLMSKYLESISLDDHKSISKYLIINSLKDLDFDNLKSDVIKKAIGAFLLKAVRDIEDASSKDGVDTIINSYKEDIKKLITI